MSDAIELDPAKIRDIAPLVLDEQGQLRIMPAEFWASTTAEERALFGHQHAIYSIPTIELVDHLRELIAGRSAIEIGAGNGVLAQALGIPGTDNCMQLLPKYRAIYQLTGQPAVRYGPDVVMLDARAAVRRYKPDVVISCWVTHKYDARRHWAGGNEIGVNEEDVIASTGQYVVIGNTHTHRTKSIWELPHTISHPSFVYSRASNGTPNFIAIWPGARS